jgi:predicted site-specific integrase-resolvase
MELFGVSQSTALRLKDGILKEAITQNGRLILCDKEKAVKLFKSRNRNTTDPK